MYRSHVASRNVVSLVVVLWASIVSAESLHEEETSLIQVKQSVDHPVAGKEYLHEADSNEMDAPAEDESPGEDVFLLSSPPDLEGAAKLVKSKLWTECMMKMQKYSDPMSIASTDFSNRHDISHKDWWVRDMPMLELQCDGACKAPPWACGNYVLRRWDSPSKYETINYETLKLTEEGATPTWQDHYADESVPWHHWMSNFKNLVAMPSETASLYVASTYSPPSHENKWLVLGMGSGAKARQVNIDTHAHVDFVELDEKSVEVAQKYFAFPDLPNTGDFGARCNDKMKVCVKMADACAHAKTLADNKEKYGLVYVDFTHHHEDLTDECLKHLSLLSEVVVFNTMNRKRLKSWTNKMVKSRKFKNVHLLPLGSNDERQFYIMATSSGALSAHAALSHAKAMDSKMSWAPFSVVDYLQKIPLKSY